MLVVLDTNVLVSALLSPTGKPAQIFRRYLNGEFQLCVDERILSEYETVLRRPKFKFSSQHVSVLMHFIRSHCLNVIAAPLDIPFIDPADKKFYEVAAQYNATLLTGNLKHFPPSPFVKTVHEL